MTTPHRPTDEVVLTECIACRGQKDLSLAADGKSIARSASLSLDLLAPATGSVNRKVPPVGATGRNRGLRGRVVGGLQIGARHSTVALLLVGALSWVSLVGCTDGRDDASALPAAPATPTSVHSGPQRPVSTLAYPKDALGSVPLSIDTVAVTQALTGLLVMSPAAAVCVSTRLERDPDLRAALGADPARSARFGEATDLAVHCDRITTGAIAFANGVQDGTGGLLTTDQLQCIRDQYAELPEEELDRMLTESFFPDRTNQPGTESPVVRAILEACQVDVNVIGLS